MTNKELFNFTGKCLMLDENHEFRQEIIEKIETDSIDWQKFITNTSNHLILPVIYLKFKSHDIIKYLPEELSEFLNEVYELNVSRNKQILEQLHKITDTLNKCDIFPVFLKGSGNLLDGLYSDIGERILGDIDLLVPEKDYLLSARLFEKDEYSITESTHVDISSMIHYPRISKPGVPAILEIHRIPVKEHNLSWFNTGIIDKEKKTVTSLEGCYTLSDKHKVIHNFIHSQLDHRGHINGIISFRDIYDLYLISKRVELEQTFPDIKYKRKARAYYIFADKAFSLEGKLYSGSGFSAWLLLKKHGLNMSSKAFYNANRSIIYLYDRIIIGYIGLFLKSFSSKSARQSVFNRLSDRKWYKAHFSGFIRFLLSKK